MDVILRGKLYTNDQLWREGVHTSYTLGGLDGIDLDDDQGEDGAN